MQSSTIRVYGDFTAMECTDCDLTSLVLTNQPKLTQLEAKNNHLNYDGLDLTGALNLSFVDFSYNDLVRLDMRPFTKLSNFTANHNSQLTTVLFPENSTEIRNIDLSDCDLTHFYPTKLPTLRYLNLSNGSLLDLALDDNYPQLRELNVSGNVGLQNLDVTQQTVLEKLSLSKTSISEINLVNNAELISLDASNTALNKLDVSTNSKLTTLDMSFTKLYKLDLSKQSYLQSINVSNTAISRIDLSKQRFIRYVNISNTAISFLDMHGAIGTNRLDHLDMRNCRAMTPQSLNFTFKAMPSHTGTSYRTNVFISGSNGEHSDTDLLDYDADNSYKVDVKGDGSASMNPVTLTKQTDSNVSFSLLQLKDDGIYETYEPIIDKALPGFPIKVIIDNKMEQNLVGFKVNNQLIEGSIFVVSTDATISPVFKTEQAIDYLTITAPVGIPQQYFLASEKEQETINIDWGNGEKEQFTIYSTPTTVTGVTLGRTITITGPIVHADFSSYPGIGVDNRISSLDVSHNPHLRMLSTFMNTLSSLDVTNQLDLRTLDCSYSELYSLDLSHNNKLEELEVYGNFLEKLDLLNLVNLRKLDVKKNWLTSIDLSNNKQLEELNVSQNEISELSLVGVDKLRDLDLSSNQLSTVDISHNPNLVAFRASNNSISSVDLSNNSKLQTLLVNNNQLHSLDLSNQQLLTYVSVGGNKWDACTLNDFYYTLPVYPKLEDETIARGNTLLVRGDKDSPNLHNDAIHAESDLATSKGWTIDYEGDGSGCSLAYITINTPLEGNLQVFTEDKTNVTSGTKMNKGTRLFLHASPNEGYSFVNYLLNNSKLEADNFVLNKSLSLSAIFTVSDAIEQNHLPTLLIQGGARQIRFYIPTSSRVKIFNLKGMLLHDALLQGSQTVELSKGLYIVKVGHVTKSIVVN